MLTLDSLTINYGQRTVLRNISLRVPPGEMLAVIGPNGAGKSTLIKLLTREILPLWTDPAPVRFLGHDRF